MANKITEYEVLSYHVKRDKEALIDRLNRNIEWVDECPIWRGPKNNRGYGLVNFRVKGRHVQLLAHRIFLTLKLKRPIANNMQAGHICPNYNQLCMMHLTEQTKTDNLRELNGRQKRKNGKFSHSR